MEMLKVIFGFHKIWEKIQRKIKKKKNEGK